MAIEGLTQQQSDFVNRFFKVPLVFGRTAKLKKRREAKDQFRLFNAEHEDVRQQIEAIPDDAKRAELLAQLRQAEAIIEADPKALNFDGAAAHLASLADAATVHVKGGEARDKFETFQARMQETTGGKGLQAAQGGADAQSDIALTWQFIQDKLNSGEETVSPADIEAALKAMDRLEVMLESAQEADSNPFAALDGAAAAATGQLDTGAMAARHRLHDVHNKHKVLKEQLVASFGTDSIPLELSFGMTATQTKLTEAEKAADNELSELADDAEENFADVNRKATKLIAQAQAWAQDEAAFLVRYQVMLSHRLKTTPRVKTVFEDITKAYTACKDLAKGHNYTQACMDIAVVRNDLRDALDLADDYASYTLVYGARKALLKTLPARDSYPLPEMADQHDAANKLLEDAETARRAKQMTTALTILNTIPKAVDDLLQLNKFAWSYRNGKAAQKKAISSINSNYTSDVLRLLKKDIDSSNQAVWDADADASAGDYRNASMKVVAQWRVCKALGDKALYLKGYFSAYELFKTKRREARARRGPEGRIAIEDYYQGLVANEAKRVAAEAVGNYRLAKSLCLRLVDKHDEMMALADDAKAYLLEETAFKAALAKLKGATSADAREALANAQDMRAYAIAATERGNWRAAKNLLENANLEIKRAVDDVETAKLIDGMQGGADKMALSGDTTFKEVYAAFAKIHAHTHAFDTQKLFTTDFAAADAKAKSIEKTMAQDQVSAETTLNEAIEECRALARKCSAADGYKAQEAAAKALLASAKSANADGIIDNELKQADDAYARATAQAGGAAPDFASAIGTLSDAQAAARTGLDAMGVYVATVKNARIKMEKALAVYRTPSCAAYLGTYEAQLQATLDQMNDDFAARRLPAAETQAAKGVTLAGHHVQLHADCEKVVKLLPYLEPAAAGPEATHALTQKAEHAEKVALVAEVKATLSKGSYQNAFRLMQQAYAVMMEGRNKVAAFEAYIVDELACETALTDLEARTGPEAGPGHDAVVALRARFDDVLAQKTLENYGGAKKRLDGFLTQAKAASDLLAVYDRYVLRQTNARKALEAVKQMKSPAIETLLTRLEGKELNADRKGQAFDFAIGTTLYEELATDCANAKGTADAVEDIVQMTNDIKAIGDQDLSDLKVAVGKMRLGLEGMRGQQSSVYIMAEIGEAQTALDAAEKLAEEDFDAGRIAVEKVIDSSTAMTLTLAQFDQLTEAAAVAQSLAKTLLARSPEVDLVRVEIEGLMATHKIAMKAARQSKANRPQTQQEVETIIASLRDLRRVVDAQARYLADLAPLKTALDELEKSKYRSLMLEDITQTRKHLDTAATRVVEKKHKDADAELKQAANRIEMAKLRAKLATDKTPDVKEIEAILNAPGGSENLDDIVENLEPTVQRKVLAVAFEARFGCALEMIKKVPKGDEAAEQQDLDKPAVNMKRFYAEMSKLPDSNTLDNDSLLTFVSTSESGGGSGYSPGKKKIAMREGDADKAGIYPIAIEHEIGDIDPDALPKPGEARTSFSWNTLHEVGHAVDDKLGYMKKHGERLAGWKVYGANVKEAATAIADNFQFDADYVAEYMLSSVGRKMPVPEPVNCDAEEWNRRMNECRIFVDRAREGNKPWQSASVAAACAIGNYTYVESYEGEWARYRTDQRKYAVSGYQFRAPGEWFSELYAATASDRLNDNHPHREEFEKICMKENA